MLCDDDGFTLCVMAFMMMEASHLKEIDAQIQEIKQENMTNITPRITPAPIIPNLEKKNKKKMLMKSCLIVFMIGILILQNALNKAQNLLVLKTIL
ncbi:hypothetical protein OLQ88_07245 [Campylobacter jejuni]|nr:hypothetical protein [Campylobacter jejuni]